MSAEKPLVWIVDPIHPVGAERLAAGAAAAERQVRQPGQAAAAAVPLRALLAEGQRHRQSQSGTLFPRFPSSAMYDRVAELGPRHLEILELVLSGCSNQEISNSTQLSLGTVKNYVSSLLLALDVRSRSHLISLFR